MKKSNLKDLRTKNLNELLKKVQDQKKELVDLMIERSLGKSKNVHQILAKRRDISQALTLLTQKSFEEKKNLIKKQKNIKEDENVKKPNR